MKIETDKIESNNNNKNLRDISRKFFINFIWDLQCERIETAVKDLANIQTVSDDLISCCDSLLNFFQTISQ